ncbi:hypothetical protein NYG90_00905 [Helicobacter sp. XJK30-2]|uniref:Uncharacterized protein n=1 Tax=Helicobacter zhangjianzhongii TaxID=2974574 RepID=A0ACC6FPW9_9HELI|nr:hypothetical protein [Helicobacter sp. XJK30-2]MDL0081251.1 hypothetical protein [Helicobacter sp. XJK30-2]
MELESAFYACLLQYDSKNCGGAVGALRFLGKVSDLSGRAFHKNRNTAALLTQS